MRSARVPGAPVLFGELEDASVLIDEIVRRHLACRIAETLKRVIRPLHTGIVEKKDIDGSPTPALAMIGRVMVPANGDGHSPRSFSICS